MPRDGAPQLAQTERLLYLRTVDAFSELPARELAALAEQTRERTFEPGERLLEQGERCRALYMVVQGRVRLVRDGQTVALVGPRSGVAALGVLSQRDAPISAVADGETLTLELPREPLMELLSDNFSMLHTVLRLLARGLRRSRRRLGQRAGYSESRQTARECPARPLDLVERLRFLREALPFASQQVAALVDLVRYSEEQRLPAGTRLWEQGDPAGWSDLLYCGSVRAEADGGRQRFTFHDGAVVGALDELAQEPRWYTATTEAPVVALRIRAEHLFDLFEDRFEVAHAFLKMVAGEQLALLEERGIWSGLEPGSADASLLLEADAADALAPGGD